MQRDYRLRRRQDFSKVYRQGKSFANKYLVLYVLPNDLDHSRFGFSVGKRVGKAVIRNRLRRRLRELCRLHMPHLQEGKDVILIARNPAQDADFDTLRRALRHLFHSAGIFNHK